MPALGDGHSFAVSRQPELLITDRQFRWSMAYDDLPFGMTVTYQGGYDDMNWHHIAQAKEFASPATPTSQMAFDQNELPKTQNHELRLTSDADQRLTWQVGGYYFFEIDPNLHSHRDNDLGAADATNIVAFHFKTKDISLATYGQATYKLTDQFSASAGVRYTSDIKYEAGTFTRLGNVQNQEHYGHWDKVTWHGGLDWNPTDVNLVYVKADRGYKDGGFTGNFNYKPEVVTAYELGTKNRFMNNKVSLNLAAFYEDYADQQVTQLTQITSTSTGQLIQNAGASEIYGLELGGEAIIDGVGRLDLDLNWLHARFTKFLASNGAGTAVPGTCNPPANTTCNFNWDLKGYSLPNAPDLAISAGFEHSWDNVLGGTVTARLETKYVTEQFFSFFNYQDTRQGPNTTSNFFLRYDQEKWMVELYVRNLEDSTVLNEATESYSTSIYRYSFAPPRTIGVRLRRTF